MALREIDTENMTDDEFGRLELAAALYHKLMKQLLPLLQEFDEVSELYYSVFPEKASDPSKRVDGLFDKLKRHIKEAK